MSRKILRPLFLVLSAVVGIGCKPDLSEIPEDKRWVPLPLGLHASADLDRRSVAIDSGALVAWVRVRYETPQPGEWQSDFRPVSSGMMRLEVNCRLKRLRVGVAHLYDSIGTHIGTENPISHEWLDTAPSSVGEMTVDSTCAVAARDGLKP